MCDDTLPFIGIMALSLLGIGVLFGIILGIVDYFVLKDTVERFVKRTIHLEVELSNLNSPLKGKRK